MPQNTQTENLGGTNDETSLLAKGMLGVSTTWNTVVRETLARIYWFTLGAEEETALVKPEPKDQENPLMQDYSLLLSTLHQEPIYQSQLSGNGVTTQIVVLLMVNGYKIQYSLPASGNVPMIQVVEV